MTQHAMHHIATHAYPHLEFINFAHFSYALGRLVTACTYLDILNICLNAQKVLLVKTSYLLTVRECLLLFGAESFVFQFAIQKVKDQDI